MHMITDDILAECFHEAHEANISVFVDPLNAACEEFNINNTKRLAAFLAQIGHESGQLKYVKENLNYSAAGLCKTFPKYFNASNAEDYDRNPEAIANKVYANRMGNGDEASGDGWKYRGRGLIQLTGRNNYMTCGEDLDEDLESNPEYLETPEGAARSAAWFWSKHKLNELADVHDLRTITKKINGGTIGYTDREHLYKVALNVLNH